MAGDGQGDPRCQPFCDGRRKGFITGRRIQKNKKGLLLQTLVLTGGAEGNRTPDLLNAIQALSQLSYAPITIKIILELCALVNTCTAQFKFCQGIYYAFLFSSAAFKLPLRKPSKSSAAYKKPAFLTAAEISLRCAAAFAKSFSATSIRASFP